MCSVKSFGTVKSGEKKSRKKKIRREACVNSISIISLYGPTCTRKVVDVVLDGGRRRNRGLRVIYLSIQWLIFSHFISTFFLYHYITARMIANEYIGPIFSTIFRCCCCSAMLSAQLVFIYFTVRQCARSRNGRTCTAELFGTWIYFYSADYHFRLPLLLLLLHFLWHRSFQNSS